MAILTLILSFVLYIYIVKFTDCKLKMAIVNTGFGA
jgi:hypothetical protein